MRITCPNCGGPHPKWECKRPAQKSSPADTGADRTAESDVSRSGRVAPAPASKNRARVAPSGDSTQLEAQAGRVVGAAKDITPIVAMDFATPTGETMHIEYLPPSAPMVEMIRSMRGRPSTGYDKKARDRERIAAKRAAAKDAK